ncbi:MAG: NAD-dependent epimerase/dehydratase family protein [Candidatus Saccharibacteria bacterium]|nr:NAD-dependent epimerase/dehydratase family protein [Candidatus Saccharibacteria bacterium]
MSEKIMVVGVNGFVGKHLARELHGQNFEVYGTGMDDGIAPEIADHVSNYTKCDLTVVGQIERLDFEGVTAVINLAGLANVGASFGNEAQYNAVNVAVHTNIVDRIQTLGRNIRVLAISTGAVYDNHQPMPLSEDGALASEASPYALSKIAMEEALEVMIGDGQDIIIARPFNHIGPGQLGGFLVPDLAQQIHSSDEVTVGNLETERDYTDVRDVVRAYILLATKPELAHRIYNVCSGKSVKGTSILELIKTGLQKEDIPVIVDQSKIRPNDPERVVGSNARILAETGWKPTYELSQTISDYLDSAFKS